MSKGKIEYDEDGLVKCEICGDHFHRVTSHARQKHDISARDYKIQFGFDLKKGICSKISAEKTRVTTLKNYDKCIGKNLLKGGASSRFKQGSVGRTKDKVSEQTRIMLKERLKQPKMIESMKKAGEAVGKSGLGNKKRYGK